MKMRVVGEGELVKRLNRMKASGQRKIARPAIREASGEVRKKAKRLAPKESGLLRKSIKNVVRTHKSSGTVYAVIGPAHGFKQEVSRGGRSVLSDPTKYAHLVEFGTQPHTIRAIRKDALTVPLGIEGLYTRVSHPGTKAQPFLRPAHQGTPSERIIQQRMWKELRKEAKK